MSKTVFYRYEDVVYAAPLDEYDYPTGPGRLVVRLREYDVVRKTPCGVWLDIGRFVRTTARKRFACATKEEALESFLARKERQARILAARLARTERAIAMVATEKAALFSSSGASCTEKGTNIMNLTRINQSVKYPSEVVDSVQ